MNKRLEDQAVWFSALCAGLAYLASLSHPSMGIRFVLVLMIGWFVWSIYKMTLDRL